MPLLRTVFPGFDQVSKGCLFLLILFLCSFIRPALSQDDPTDPVSVYNKTVIEIQKQNWDEALNSVNGIISEWGDSGVDKFGPVFGHFYFLRGIVQLGKEDFEAALISFKTCYEKFSNKILEEKSDEELRNLRPNLFMNAALVQWANTEMRLEKYAAARDLYEKVLVEGKNDRKVNKVFVGVNLGRCYLKAGDIKKGYEFMIRPLANENLNDSLRETIFMVMAEDWSPVVKFSEVRSLLEKHSRIVDSDPFEERYERNARFQFLAQTAISKSDPVRALGWYERMVNPRLLLPAYQRRYDSLKNRVVVKELEEKKKEALGNLLKQINQLESGYLQILNGVGSAHFMMQNFSGSYIAFSQLSDQAGKNHKERPIFLHNAVVSAAQIEQWKNAYKYGRQFLDEFPKHELKPGVARVLVEVIFLREEYAEAHSVSKEVREDMKPGAEIRDIPDFVAGASAFHIGNIEEAEIELTEYLKNYPKGQRRELAQFFLGLTKIRLRKWEEAASIFNIFLKEFPKSALTATALYQCALAEFMLDRLDEALAKIEIIHSKHPNSDVLASSWNLKGDIYAGLDDKTIDDIIACFTKGRDIAVETSQPEIAAYAVWQLTIHTSDAQQWDQAEAHYDDFQKNYPNSEYRYDLLAGALPMLVEQKRAGEGLEKLREIVWQSREDPESSILSEMFGTYVDFLKTNFGADESLVRLAALRSTPGISKCLTGWILVAEADILEEQEKSADIINKKYYSLGAGFNPAQHSNYPIVRLARWTAGVRGKPAEAKPLYDFILKNRPGTANYDDCLIDTADLQAVSKDSAQREEAMKKYRQVIAEIPKEELQERAVLGMARIRTAEKNYKEAQPLWEKYLKTRSWTLSRPEANYQLGYATEKQGNPTDALKIYVSVYANFPGHLDWSTRAYLRTAAILKGQGEDLKSLQVLQDMLKRLGHHKHPGIAKGKEVFIKWRSEYKPQPAAENE